MLPGCLSCKICVAPAASCKPWVSLPGGWYGVSIWQTVPCTPPLQPLSSSCPTLDWPVMQPFSHSGPLCRLSRSPLGPSDIHILPRPARLARWLAARAVNWCSDAAGCRFVTYLHNTCRLGELLSGHCSSHLHLTSRRPIQSRPQNLRLGCLITSHCKTIGNI